MALVCVSDYEEEAAKLMKEMYWEFFRSGASAEKSLQLNRTAFDK